MGIKGSLLANPRVKQVSLSAVIKRADGTIEELPNLAYWHRNPFKRWWRNLMIAIGTYRGRKSAE